jgi:hypothetical protein
MKDKQTGISITDGSASNFYQLACHQRGKKQVSYCCGILLGLNVKTQVTFGKAGGWWTSLVQLLHLECKHCPTTVYQTQP